jgi:hypothetical protein
MELQTKEKHTPQSDHVQMYSFSRNCKLEKLCDLVICVVEASRKPGLQSLIEIAKEAYGSLVEDDTWFTEYFKSAIREALDENPRVSDQLWIRTPLDVLDSLLWIFLLPWPRQMVPRP